jgi:hypothetical protein
VFLFYNFNNIKWTHLVAVIAHPTLQHALAAQFAQAGVELNGCHAELASESRSGGF